MVGFACMFLSVGCSVIALPTEPPRVVGGVQVGIASWYGPGFDGKRTSSGEVYDQDRLTAAHRTLPIGTHLMVTSLTNGRSVEVRVNDRGPFVDGRIVDISKRAAQDLAMIGPGTMRVRLEVVHAPGSFAARRLNAPGDAPLPLRVSYVVQVGTFSRETNARALHSDLAARFSDAHVATLNTGWTEYFRVRIGPYETRRMAEARAAVVERLGYPTIVMEGAPMAVGSITANRVAR